ncbi:MAG: folate-binding protein YgfZ [Alphaproteobacteria bacterium]|nr:MAG: folate-binding protein YgfZ [Alphaproteobacteria bacterium]
MNPSPTIVELDDRAVLAVTGADARSFLQGLLTNDLDQLAVDCPLYAGLLSPQGKALFDMILFADPDGVLVDVAAARGPALARRLSMYRLRKAVTIAPSPLRVLAGWNGAEAGHPADPRFAALGARWLADGATPGSAAYDAHRLQVGVPDSADIGEDELLWLETGADLLGGVSFTKGCYVGQENTARMHHRDKVRRRLVPVSIAGDPGDGVVRDAAGRTAGTLRSHAGGLGIAHLRLEAAAGPLTAGGAALTVGRPAWLEPALAAAVAGA